MNIDTYLHPENDDGERKPSFGVDLSGRALALCALDDVDPEIFYPEFENLGTAREALKICNQCTVKDLCLAEANELESEERYGVRGGLTSRQRHKRHPSTGPNSV